MKNARALLVILALIVGVSLSCKLLKDKVSKTADQAPKIDFTTTSNGLDVKVDLDKNQTTSQTIGKAGGSMSLTKSDGSKFTLEVPANALDAETTITMTSIKTVDGAPLDTNTPAAVQLEPSGLLLRETATLTIVPAVEIPVKNHVVFGYEADGKDYHLAPIDPKSKDVKVKIKQFSGAGMGSASETAWAANLMIQARDAALRLEHKLGEYTQSERREIFASGNEGDGGWHATFKSYLEQYEDQVVRKEMAAADLDCRHARAALHHLIGLEHDRATIGIPENPSFRDNMAKYKKLGDECQRAYHAEGTSDGAFFKGDICSLDKPFTINVDSKTGKWPMNFTPEGASGGTMEGTFSANGCNLTGGGTYTTSLGADGSGTITFTYNSTASCPGLPSRTTSRTATLQLKPAPELSCP